MQGTRVRALVRLKIYIEIKRPRTINIFLKKSKVGEVVLPDVKIYYNAMLRQHGIGIRIDK